MEHKLCPKKFARFLVGCMLFFAVLNALASIPVFFGRAYPFGPFNLDAEQNLPTLFSTLMLLFCAFITGYIACVERLDRMAFVQWVAVSMAFLTLGVDEFTEIHEKIAEPIALIQASGVAFQIGCVALSIAVSVVLGVLYFRLFQSLPRETRIRLVIAVVLYAGGAIVFDEISGCWRERFGRNGVYLVLASLEELLEMSGCIAFIRAFLLYVDQRHRGLVIRITSS